MNFTINTFQTSRETKRNGGSLPINDQFVEKITSKSSIDPDFDTGKQK